MWNITNLSDIQAWIMFLVVLLFLWTLDVGQFFQFWIEFTAFIICLIDSNLNVFLHEWFWDSVILLVENLLHHITNLSGHLFLLIECIIDLNIFWHELTIWLEQSFKYSIQNVVKWFKFITEMEYWLRTLSQWSIKESLCWSTPYGDKVAILRLSLRFTNLL